MGTNFYAVMDAPSECPTCGHAPEPVTLHIGKRSRGWAFALHAEYRGAVPRDLEGWRKVFDQAVRIVDDCGLEYTPNEMLAIIVGDGNPEERRRQPNRLRKSNQAAGYDLVEGEFS